MRASARGVVAVVVVTLLITAGHALADKKVRIKEHKGQVTQTFKNETGFPAYGLKVSFSNKAVVVTDDENRAGPFGDVSGNDTTGMKLTNPDEPIEQWTEVELTFRSHNAGLKIGSWHWLDEKGKKLGTKNKN